MERGRLPLSLAMARWYGPPMGERGSNDMAIPSTSSSPWTELPSVALGLGETRNHHIDRGGLRSASAAAHRASGVPFVRRGTEPLPQELRHAVIVAIRFGDDRGAAEVRTVPGPPPRRRTSMIRSCWSLHSCPISRRARRMIQRSIRRSILPSRSTGRSIPRRNGASITRGGRSYPRSRPPDLIFFVVIVVVVTVA